MLLSDFHTRIKAMLGLATSDETLITSYVNEGILDFLVRTNVRVIPGTAALEANSDDYELDTDILKIIDAYVTVSGDSSPWGMEQVSVEELLEMRRRGATVSSPPTHYAVGGANLLMVYPTPASADTVTFYFVPRPTSMSEDSHDPSVGTYGGIPAEFHRGLELFGLWRMADQEDDESSQQGERYHALYEDFLTKTVKPALIRKGGATAPRARIGRRSTLPTRHNDRY